MLARMLVGKIVERGPSRFLRKFEEEILSNRKMSMQTYQKIKMMSSSVFIHRTRSIPCFLWLKVDSSSRNPFWSSYGKGFHLRNFSSQPENSIKRYYTIPNFICLSRIAATPLICHFVLSGQDEMAFYGLVVAAISDGLDGLIARNFDQKSVLGSHLDPLSDKILVNSLMISCAIKGTLPVWLVSTVFFRDFFLIAGSFAVAIKGASQAHQPLTKFVLDSDKPLEIKASFISKCNTVLQLALLASAMGGTAFPQTQVIYMVPMLSYATATTTWMSLIGYVYNPGIKDESFRGKDK